VDQVEYLTDILSVWPIPKLPTAFILDLLQDNRKYLLHKKSGSIDAWTQTLAMPDFLIKNKASKIHNILKCPCSPVADNLDTANILKTSLQMNQTGS
jgi:hypothetical protein